MTNFSKNTKNAILGSFWALFVHKWIFLEKRVLPVFKYSNYLPLCQKSEKRTERQTDNCDFIGPSVGRRTNYYWHSIIQLPILWNHYWLATLNWGRFNQGQFTSGFPVGNQIPKHPNLWIKQMFLESPPPKKKKVGRVSCRTFQDQEWYLLNTISKEHDHETSSIKIYISVNFV